MIKVFDVNNITVAGYRPVTGNRQPATEFISVAYRRHLMNRFIFANVDCHIQINHLKYLP